ncbi:MAG TPA: TonB-dependent receptor [Vicinamibacterales bacterium]|nr:TonB-dependent receptor [Vicinamibacterales bacterium]
MVVRTICRAFAVFLVALVMASHAAAQDGVPLSGRLLISVNGQPLAGATIQIEELRRQATSAGDGTFRFENVPPGTYHLSVLAQGFSTRRTEVTAAAGAGPLELQVDFDLHFEEVVSVSGDARSQFETFQPTSVLAGQELSKQLEMSLGATLESQPGVASRSFGPAPARPVIRGLDGDRVLILQDGQRLGDLSSQSGDHGVPINPAAAQKIEVVRGPATLLYGANAIGGLVNVITDEIPTRPEMGTTGNLTFDLGSGANEAGAAGDVHIGNGKVALHVGGGGRRSSDVSTPEGDVVNSQSRSGFGNVGLSWTGERSYFGGSYGYDDTKYGIPVIEEGQVQLTPRRHALSIRGGGQGLQGAFDSYRATLAIRRYKHDELEGSEVGTAFSNHTEEVEVMGGHRAIGRLKGSLGGWFLNRAFDAVGEEALSPAVDQRGFATFIYEEVTWPHVTFQFGGRLDHTRYQPNGEPDRSFTSGSGSVGLLVRPAGADDRLTIAISAARAARNPALEELFYFGPHPGNFAFEVGNPELGPEHAFGFDLSLRWRTPRVTGEVTYFRNSVNDYLFRAPLTEEEFEARLDEFAVRFPSRDIGGEAEDEQDEEFPIVEYVAADSILQGFEAHSDIQLTAGFAAEVGFDYVQGTLDESNEPLPRIPPFRFRGGLRYQRSAFQAGGEIVVTATQDRVFSTETPTDGYQLGRIFAAYSFGQGAMTHTVTARLENVTDELYRNHLSLIKDLVPEMGRNFKLLYNVRF